MGNQIKVIFILFFICLHPSASAEQNCDAKMVSKIETALKVGKSVLILAWGPKESCADDDEACGDWAADLNNFAQSEKGKIEVFKVSSRKWPSFISVSLPSISERSALFMKKDRTTYFYQGPILERQVYQSVTDAWRIKSKGGYQAFLPPAIKTSLCK